MKNKGCRRIARRQAESESKRLERVEFGGQGEPELGQDVEEASIGEWCVNEREECVREAEGVHAIGAVHSTRCGRHEDRLWALRQRRSSCRGLFLFFLYSPIWTGLAIFHFLKPLF